jgi:hypothetical protein
MAGVVGATYIRRSHYVASTGPWKKIGKRQKKPKKIDLAVQQMNQL